MKHIDLSAVAAAGHAEPVALPEESAGTQVGFSGEHGEIRCMVEVRDSLAEVRDAWLGLQQRALVHPFQDWHWHRAWASARNFAQNERLFIAVVRDGAGCVQAIYPLHVLPFIGRLKWVQPMAQQVSDYSSPLVAPGFVASAGEAGLEQLFLYILSLRGSRGGWQALRQPAGMPGYLAGRRSSFPLLGHVASISGDWQSWYEARRSVRSRKNDRYREKRLNAEGGMKVRLAGSCEEALEITRLAIDVKRRQLAERGVKSAFEDEQVRQTFLNLAADPGGPMRAFVLTVGDEPLATSICLVGGQRACYVIAAYEPGKHDGYSPGAVLLRHIMMWAFEQQLTLFDFTIGDESYKLDWSDATMPLCYAAGADSMTGMVKVAALHARIIAEQLLRQDERLLLLAQRLKSAIRRR